MPDKKNNKKRKRFFLVDYENVKSDGLQGVDELDKNDNVIIFYSANAGKLSFDLHTQLLDTKSKVTYFEVDTIGQNALDFQLSSYIGYILGKKSDCECYIISNDRDLRTCAISGAQEGYACVSSPIYFILQRTQVQPESLRSRLPSRIWI